jgi:hypothetical protein
MHRTPLARQRARLVAGALASALLLAACGGSGGGGPQTVSVQKLPPATGPEGIGLQSGTPLAGVVTTESGNPINGVQCEPLEQLAHQADVYLRIYIYGHPRSLPAGIGEVSPNPDSTDTGTVYQAGQCYYWLHTDAADGVIQADTPNTLVYQLGTFFDIWDVRLGVDHLGSWSGHVTAIVNGRRWFGSPRLIRLRPHTAIELAIGRNVPRFQEPDWADLRGQPLIGG